MIRIISWRNITSLEQERLFIISIWRAEIKFRSLEVILFFGQLEVVENLISGGSSRGI